MNSQVPYRTTIFLLIFIFAGAALSAISAGKVPAANAKIANKAAAVEQWKIYEITFTASKTYANPYKDIYADVKFTNGATGITMPMFWDGNNIWKARFAPPLTGDWTWEIVNANAAALSDAGLTGAQAGDKGRTFKCRPPAKTEKRKLYKHGFVNVAKNPGNPSANGTYMAYADGTAFFWSSYIPAGTDYKIDFWHNDMPKADPDKGQFQMNIDRAASAKYNVIKFLFLDWFSGFNKPDKADPFPHYPAIFPGTDPSRFNRLSQAAIDIMQKEVDPRMDYMAGKDMTIELESCYANHIYTDSNKDGVCEDNLQGFKDWYRYLYGRYGAYPITLSCGYELPWYYDGQKTEGVNDRDIRLEKYNELYNYCDSIVQKNRPLTGVLIAGSPVSHTWDAGDANNSFCMSLVDGNALSVIQPMQHVCFSNVKEPVIANNRTRDFYAVYEAYYARLDMNRKNHPDYIVKPIIGDETGWEGAINPEYVLNPPADITDTAFMSLNMWKTALLTAGTSYGADAQKLPWYKVLYDYPGLAIGAKIMDLFNNPKLPWWKMPPVLNEEANHLAKWTNPNIAAQPWQKPDIRTDYKRDFPDANQTNSNFLIYFPSYPKGEFDKIKEGDLFNILQPVGTRYKVKWYNPTKGGYTSARAIKTYDGGANGASLQLPSKPDDNDWILWLSVDGATRE